MASKVVFFRGGCGPLLLSGFKGDSLTFKGFVENGCWYAKYEAGVLTASDEYHVKNRITCDVLCLVDVVKGAGRDYNEIITWAEKQLEALNGQ